MEGFVHYNNYYDLIRLSSYLAEPCGPCDLLTTRNAGSGECRLWGMQTPPVCPWTDVIN